MKPPRQRDYICVLSKRTELLRRLKREAHGSGKIIKAARSSRDILKLLATVPLLAIWVDAKFVDQNMDALETGLYLKDCIADLPIQLICEQASQLLQAISNIF
jgi:hypothetical protein